MRERNPGLEEKLCIAALRLAAAHDWSALTLDQIAKTAKISPAEARKIFADKDMILPALVRRTDAQVAASIGKRLTHGTPRDRLFEVMMARIDILQASRKATLNIIATVRREPRLAQALLPAEMKAIKEMVSLAGLTLPLRRQPFVIGGLLAIYGFALCRWRSDDSRDLGKTMAALDRGLSIAEKAAKMFFGSMG